MQQDAQEHLDRAARIEALIQDVASFADAHARDTTEALIQALMDMYGEGLARILALVEQTVPPDAGLMEALAGEELVASLFLLHDLHPRSIEERITQALVEIRPYLKAHGGNVEFVRVENGIAYVRLEGSCQGCDASTITLKTTIEEAIYNAAPDLEGLEVEGVTDAPQSKPLMFVPRRRKESQNGALPKSSGLAAPTR